MGLLPKQLEVLNSPATEILFGGAAGPGKSHLLRIMAIIYCTMIPGIQVYLFRRLSPDLEANHMDGPTGFRALLAEYEQRGVVDSMGGKPIKIRFSNGANIHLSHCQHEKDRFKYQGPEFHVLLIDEGTHFTDVIYRYLRGRLRAPKELKVPEDFPFVVPRIVIGSNPGGIGHNTFRRMFLVGREPLSIERMPPQEGGMLRQYVPARLIDNPFIDYDEYIGQLHGLGSPALVKAMADGDWNIVAGGMLDDIWNMETASQIELAPFSIPPTWEVTRSFDWGSSKPFSVGWWAESNGEEVTLRDGTTRSFHPGTLIRVHEWYGCEKERPNTGLKMLASEIAKGILERERFFSFKVTDGPADSSIFDTVNGMCIADDMADEGVSWTKADKSPGSRVNGAELIRTMLKASLTYPMEAPGMFVFNHCRDFIDLMPIMPRDEKNSEDVDTESEDHIWDETRYRALMPIHKGTTGRIAAH